ncbi:MAG: sigma-70 family RNA polymerase sigma factor [Planctomycetota bacterium]|nr:sigma-70 family RNA polymerase sigma factor [Planctomycetota bacterium]
MAQNGLGALGDLFDLTAARTIRFASTLTRNPHDAEDAVQAAMVRVALHPKSLAKADHPWAYLLRIVRNEALKICQKKRPSLALSLFDEQGEEPELDLADSRQFVQKAVELLPPAQSEVIVLKIWEGLTFAEIAAVLGESPNTAASRYRYALQKLTLTLQPLVEETH